MDHHVEIIGLKNNPNLKKKKIYTALLRILNPKKKNTKKNYPEIFRVIISRCMREYTRQTTRTSIAVYTATATVWTKKQRINVPLRKMLLLLLLSEFLLLNTIPKNCVTNQHGV